MSHAQRLPECILVSQPPRSTARSPELAWIAFMGQDLRPKGFHIVVALLIRSRIRGPSQAQCSRVSPSPAKKWKAETCPRAGLHCARWASELQRWRFVVRHDLARPIDP